MYIPPFWCGVAVTVLVEILITSILVVCSSWGKKDEKSNNKSNQ